MLNHGLRIVRTHNLDLIRKLDAMCFDDGSRPIENIEVATWWVVRNSRREAVAYAGIKPYHLGGAYLCRAGVLPEARGMGLQRRLIRVRVAWARRDGRTWVFTDTRRNPVSANNLIACGFKSYEPVDPWADAHTAYWIKELVPGATRTAA